MREWQKKSVGLEKYEKKLEKKKRNVVVFLFFKRANWFIVFFLNDEWGGLCTRRRRRSRPVALLIIISVSLSCVGCHCVIAIWWKVSRRHLSYFTGFYFILADFPGVFFKKRKKQKFCIFLIVFGTVAISTWIPGITRFNSSELLIIFSWLLHEWPRFLLHIDWLFLFCFYLVSSVHFGMCCCWFIANIIRRSAGYTYTRWIFPNAHYTNWRRR